MVNINWEWLARQTLTLLRQEERAEKFLGKQNFRGPPSQQSLTDPLEKLKINSEPLDTSFAVLGKYDHSYCVSERSPDRVIRIYGAQRVSHPIHVNSALVEPSLFRNFIDFSAVL